MPAPFADPRSWRTLPSPDPATAPLPVSASAPQWCKFDDRLHRGGNGRWTAIRLLHPHNPDERTSSTRHERTGSSGARRPRGTCGSCFVHIIESDLIRMRTREGMKVAKAKGRLRGKPPKLSPTQETHLVGLYRAGQHITAELAELFSVGRSTVYRAVQRAGEPGAARTQS